MYVNLPFIQTIAKTLNPQWREQFDFHLYEEQGGYVDITVWDRDAGKKDDFMGRYSSLYHSLFFLFFNSVAPQQNLIGVRYLELSCVLVLC